MRIQQICLGNSYNLGQVRQKNTAKKPTGYIQKDYLPLHNVGYHKIHFGRYLGDAQPVKRLYWILTGNSFINNLHIPQYNLFKNGETGWKKWTSIEPQNLLKMEASKAIESILSINNTQSIPEKIYTPNYGNNWGRRANYIELNPRTIAQVENNQVSEGFLNLTKLLPAIPPSSNTHANCIILSQLYPALEKDGITGASSLYSIDIKSGISKNLTSTKLYRNGEKIKDEELAKSFNDLAHLRGLKTGIRMPLSAGQMKVAGRDFDWYSHENDFIQACCDAIDMGFDSIYFDSAKHIGNFDMGNYMGVGDLPNYKQMQYITSQIRERTGRQDISLIGEKCFDDKRFKELGLTAGTDWGGADNRGHIFHEYEKQKAKDFSNEYAAGPDISNDNDYGGMSFEQRLNRIKNALNGYESSEHKLPVFMQMTDIFPLSPYTNTHSEMLKVENRSAFGDINSHYNNIFNTSQEARNHTFKVFEEFLNKMY